MELYETINKVPCFNYTNQNNQNFNLWRKYVFGFEFYELFWIFILFSIGGLLIETVWCLITCGYIESRKGLIFGPFCPIYGVGAVVLIVLLSSLNQSKLKLAFGSFFYGSVIEYIFSLLQQKLFGTVSWDYSKMPFNINGRICLMYSLGWSLLGIILIKYIYPKIVVIIKSIPRDEGEYLATLLAIFILYDIFISVVAVIRADRRSYFVQAQNIFEKYLDKYFNDQTMHKVFPNMKFRANELL